MGIRYRGGFLPHHLRFFTVDVNCTDTQPHGNLTCVYGDRQRVPVFCGYARPGNAEGRPAFVNYARFSDFSEAFTTSPTSICSSDVIALARHGWNSYGQKVGALVNFCKRHANGTLPQGMIIYDDPADFVPPDGKVFPEGIGLPEDGISFRVAKMSREGVIGDPESPGLPAIGTIISFLLT